MGLNLVGRNEQLDQLKKIPDKVKRAIREKAIRRAEAQIVLAGRKPSDLSEQELEIVVKDEEDKLLSSYKDKGLLATLALFGLSLWT